MGDLPILRYAAPIGKTRDQMRSWLRNTDEGRALYNHGDCRLVWVNEGDLDRVQFLTDIAATRETDLRAEVERLTQERDEARGRFNDLDLCHMGVAPCQTLISAHDEAARLRGLLDDALRERDDALARLSRMCGDA